MEFTRDLRRADLFAVADDVNFSLSHDVPMIVHGQKRDSEHLRKEIY
jgi:hypothetical protein